MTLKVIATAALVLLGTIGSAQAGPRTFDFTASVNSGSVPAAQLVTGSFTYDDAAPITQGPYAAGSVWFSGLTAFTFATGALSGSLTTPNLADSLLVWNEFVGALDGFHIQPQAMTGTPNGVNALVSADLSLTDSTRTAFSSLTLPSTLNLSAFDGRLLHVVYAGGSEFYASLTSLTLRPSAVPEPASWALLAAGLVAAGAAARRRRASAGAQLA